MANQLQPSKRGLRGLFSPLLLRSLTLFPLTLFPLGNLAVPHGIPLCIVRLAGPTLLVGPGRGQRFTHRLESLHQPLEIGKFLRRCITELAFAASLVCQNAVKKMCDFRDFTPLILPWVGSQIEKQKAQVEAAEPRCGGCKGG